MDKTEVFYTFDMGSTPLVTTIKLQVDAEVACKAHNLEAIGSSPIPATE